jgi:hypothetical protein
MIRLSLVESHVVERVSAGGMTRSHRLIDRCARSKTRCGYMWLEANDGATKMLAIMVGFFRHRLPPSHHGILASR